MNCFNHPDKPAVGFCKSCYKGLCSECAAVIENGLACRNACEERVRLINGILDNNEKITVEKSFILPKMADSATVAITYWADMKEVKVPFEVKATLGLE